MIKIYKKNEIAKESEGAHHSSCEELYCYWHFCLCINIYTWSVMFVDNWSKKNNLRERHYSSSNKFCSDEVCIEYLERVEGIPFQHELISFRGLQSSNFAVSCNTEKSWCCADFELDMITSQIWWNAGRLRPHARFIKWSPRFNVAADYEEWTKSIPNEL